MPRLIKVGAGGGEISWLDALKDLRGDDVIFLEPGFYEVPQGLTLADITIKGMGSSPEDTVILGYIKVAEDSRFVNIENLCINTITDNNTLYVPAEANSYLSLRNCVIKGTNTDTTTIAANGKVTLELYSTKVINGSVSMFENADFRLEMNDSLIDYPSDEYCALALEGKGTAIINNSTIRGTVNTFPKTNCELDFNNSQLDFVLLRGKTWLNMLNTTVNSTEDACLYISDECWGNVINSTFKGGVLFDRYARVIVQNSTINRLMVANDAQLTLVSGQILTHADFQDNAVVDATRVSFNGDLEFEYFLVLSGKARLNGHDLILNSNGAELAVDDDATFNTNVLASDQSSLEITCSRPAHVNIYGMHWTSKKK